MKIYWNWLLKNAVVKHLWSSLALLVPLRWRAALNNQLPSKELIDILQRRHTQAIIDLLRAKYMLIDNCRKLQQQVTTALQIFATGMFTTDWAKQFITLTATWQQLQPHFATVLSGEADDYQVVSELQRDWQRFAPIRKVLARIENQAQATRSVRGNFYRRAPAIDRFICANFSAITYVFLAMAIFAFSV